MNADILIEGTKGDFIAVFIGKQIFPLLPCTGKIDAAENITVLKCPPSDRGDGFGNGNAFQACAVVKCVFSYRSDSVRHYHACQTAAFREGPVSNRKNGIGKGNAFQLLASGKSLFTDSRDGIGYHYACLFGGTQDKCRPVLVIQNAVLTGKRGIAAVNGNAFQTPARPECKPADRSKGFRNGNARQLSAEFKSPVSDRCNSIGNGQRSRLFGGTNHEKRHVLIV